MRHEGVVELRRTSTSPQSRLPILKRTNTTDYKTLSAAITVSADPRPQPPQTPIIARRKSSPPFTGSRLPVRNLIHLRSNSTTDSFTRNKVSSSLNFSIKSTPAKYSKRCEYFSPPSPKLPRRYSSPLSPSSPTRSIISSCSETQIMTSYPHPHLLSPCTLGSLTHRLDCTHLLLTPQPMYCTRNCSGPTSSSSLLIQVAELANPRELDGDGWVCSVCNPLVYAQMQAQTQTQAQRRRQQITSRTGIGKPPKTTVLESGKAARGMGFIVPESVFGKADVANFGPGSSQRGKSYASDQELCIHLEFRFTERPPTPAAPELLLHQHREEWKTQRKHDSFMSMPGLCGKQTPDPGISISEEEADEDAHTRDEEMTTATTTTTTTAILPVMTNAEDANTTETMQPTNHDRLPPQPVVLRPRKMRFTTLQKSLMDLRLPALAHQFDGDPITKGMPVFRALKVVEEGFEGYVEGL